MKKYILTTFVVLFTAAQSYALGTGSGSTGSSSGTGSSSAGSTGSQTGTTSNTGNVGNTGSQTGRLNSTSNPASNMQGTNTQNSSLADEIRRNPTSNNPNPGVNGNTNRATNTIDDNGRQRSINSGRELPTSGTLPSGSGVNPNTNQNQPIDRQ